jgi:quercetin dioxygenase-like cupin family protein
LQAHQGLFVTTGGDFKNGTRMPTNKAAKGEGMDMNMVAAATVVSLSIARAGTQPSQKGSAEYFTGSVRIDPVFQAKESTRASGAYVTFEPGARSAWHTHPLGQTLIVTAGVGRVQIEGAPIEEIRPGDVVWIPPGQRHWHGASPTTAMTHLAVQEQLNGKVVEWMEKVTDEQYAGAATR